MVEIEWFPRFKEHHRSPRGIVISCDTAEKDKDVDAPSVLSVFLLTHHVVQLVKVVRKRMIYSVLKTKVKATCQQAIIDYNAPLVALVIEDKSSGTQLIQELRQDGKLPVVAFEPGQYGSKENRCDLSTGTLEAGLVALPQHAPWLDLWEDEITNFPNADYADQMDSLSQFVLWHNQLVEQRPSVSTL